MISRDALSYLLVGLGLMLILIMLAGMPINDPIATAYHVCLILYLVTYKTEIKVQARGLFEDNYASNELFEKMKEDPEFAQALRYIYTLSSRDFLAFSRLVIEARYTNDQTVLKLISRQFRRELGVK